MTESPHKRQLEQARSVMMLNRYNRATITAQLVWIEDYLNFLTGKNPQDTGESEIAAYIAHLASKPRVPAVTQNEALTAVLFYYKHILKKRLGLIHEPEE